MATLIDYLPLAIILAPVVGAMVAAVQNRREIAALVRDLREVDRACGEDGFQW